MFSPRCRFFVWLTFWSGKQNSRRDLQYVRDLQTYFACHKKSAAREKHANDVHMKSSSCLQYNSRKFIKEYCQLVGCSLIIISSFSNTFSLFQLEENKRITLTILAIFHSLYKKRLKFRTILFPYKKCVTEMRASVNKLKLPLF